jgi:hypothetical protein
MGAAVGADDDHAGEAGRGSDRVQVEGVPTEGADGAAAGSGHDGELEEQGDAGVDLFGFGQELDDVDVGRGLDLFFEDLAGLAVLGGVAADPAPLHRLAKRGAHDRLDAVYAGGRQRPTVAAGLVVAGCPVSAGALVRTRRAVALLAAAAGPVLGARRGRARAVAARAAAAGELGVEDVERVGGDLGDVDVVEGAQIAGDDAAVLLERVRRPAALLDRDPLGGEVAEGPPRVRRGVLAEFHFPGVGLVLGVPLADGVDRPRGPALGAGERVAACVDPELPPAGGELSNARHRDENLRRATDGWHDGWHARELKKPSAFAKGF